MKKTLPDIPNTPKSPPLKPPKDKLPCNMTCSKCGSNDINRHHRLAGERFDKSIGDYEVKETDFISKHEHYTVAIFECITHHCRECQYDWETEPMTKN